MWDPKGKVSQDSLVFPTQGGRLLVILSIHSCVMGIRQEQRDQADSLQSRPSQGSSMINKGADHLFGPGTAGGPDKDGGLPPGRAGAAAPRARAIKEWDSHGKSGGSQQLQDRRHKTGVYISS